MSVDSASLSLLTMNILNKAYRHLRDVLFVFRESYFITSLYNVLMAFSLQAQKDHDIKTCYFLLRIFMQSHSCIRLHVTHVSDFIISIRSNMIYIKY